MEEKLIGVFKEVGKTPKPKVIWNKKEEIEKLVGGEYVSLKCDKFTIIFNKKSDSMLANVCIDFKGRGIGTSIKGKLFAIKENEKGEFHSFANMDELKSVAKFLNARGLDYTNFDEKGKYLTKAERRKRELEKLKKKRSETQKKIIQTSKENEMNISDSFFENNFRLVPVVHNDQEKCISDSNENKTEAKSDDNLDNKSINKNDKGKLILERTPESSTTTESNKEQVPNIVLGDETIFKMLLKIQIIILEFLRKVADGTDEE